MMKYKQSQIESMLFALLRMALHETNNSSIQWKDVTQDEWVQIYKLAAHHGVVAIAWDGLQYVMNQCALPRTLKISWGLAVDNCEQRHALFCQTVTVLSDFYKKHGIGLVQLKGVGFSAYYPIPAHREGGDIDIYTYSLDKEKMSDKDANDMADQLIAKQGIEVVTDSYKHSCFSYQGILVENHKCFLDVKFLKIAEQMNEMLHELLIPRPLNLVKGNNDVMVPPANFNALFIAFHAAQHFGLGFRIHHLFDWACLLKREGWCLPEEVKDTRLLNFIYALTALSNQLLGTHVPVKENESFENLVYEQMMHPLYSEKELPVKGTWAILKYKWKRMRYDHKMLGHIFDVILFERFMHVIWFHIKKPWTTFK